MSDKISYYMDAISRVMRQLADSNLEIPHYDDFQGDFLPVQESLLIVLNSLNETISEINMFSDQVANGADQVSMVHRSFHRGLLLQASSVEELAATMSEISQQVKENAETSQVVKTAAGEMGCEYSGLQSADAGNEKRDGKDKSEFNANQINHKDH